GGGQAPQPCSDRLFEGTKSVASIEPPGLQMPMYDITTATADSIANGVVSHNCRARPTHDHRALDAGRHFERRIALKTNPVERAGPAPPPAAAGGRGPAQRGGRPDRRPRRPDPARPVRRPRATRSRPPRGPRGRRGVGRADRAPPPPGCPPAVHGLAGRAPPR